MDDHLSTRRVLQRSIAGGVVGAAASGRDQATGASAKGAPVSAAELERALAHLVACDECARDFDVAAVVTWLESREASHEMANVPVDPEALFKRALTAALSHSDSIVRERAAARLGGFADLDAAALSALVAAARDDAEGRVRAAALSALDRLDGEVSFPQRVIDAWAATPAEAAGYLASVLARLAAGEVPSAAPGEAAGAGVTRLAATEQPAPGERDVELSGDRGVSGRVALVDNGLWLTVQGLPAELENTKPVVAIPKALGEEVPQIIWAGGGRGLVTATDSVTAGSVRVLLGNAKRSAGGAFDRIYLLHPRVRRTDV